MKYLLNFFILTKILLTVKNKHTEFYWQFYRNFDDFILVKPKKKNISLMKNKIFTLLPLTMASFSWPSLYFCITVSTSSMSRYPQPSLSHFSKSESIMCFLWVDSASFLACSQSQELLIRAEQKNTQYIICSG